MFRRSCKGGWLTFLGSLAAAFASGGIIGSGLLRQRIRLQLWPSAEPIDI
jgi:hypothetical protein